MLRYITVMLAAPLLFADVEAGRQLYLGSCSGCHGKLGEGSQGPSLLTGRVSRLSNAALRGVIRNGLPGTTMPGFPLEAGKMEGIVGHLRSLTAPAAAARVSGDAARGRALFFGAAKCSGCHMVRGEGGYPGPDLSNIGAERTLLQLRESLAKPSERIGDGYRPAKATLRGGRVVSGVAKNHNNYSVQILDRTGRLHLLERTELTDLTIGDQSLMPVTEAGATTDLLAFLAGLTMRPYEGEAR